MEQDQENNQVGQAEAEVGQLNLAPLYVREDVSHVENCGCPECDVCDCGCGQSGPTEPVSSTIPVEKIDAAIAKVFVAQQRMTGEQAKAFLREERRNRRLAAEG